MESVYNKRSNQLRQQMAAMRIDCFLVTDLRNVYYLSGFTGDAGVLLITENNLYLITDGRFTKQVQIEAPDYQALITRDYLGVALDLVEKENLVALGFENTISYLQYDFLDEYAVSDIVPMDQVIEKIRSVKDQAEIDTIKEACRLAKLGYEFVLDHIKPGQTERYVANELDYFMKSIGASEASFETIVASGERSALPHGVASDKVIAAGDFVTLDFGYYFDRYTSDVTRTFSVGEGEHTAQLKEIHEIVLKAQQATIAAIKPGVTGAQLDQIGRQVIVDAGYGEYFSHGDRKSVV